MSPHGTKTRKVHASHGYSAMCKLRTAQCTVESTRKMIHGLALCIYNLYGATPASRVFLFSATTKLLGTGDGDPPPFACPADRCQAICSGRLNPTGVSRFKLEVIRPSRLRSEQCHCEAWECPSSQDDLLALRCEAMIAPWETKRQNGAWQTWILCTTSEFFKPPCAEIYHFSLLMRQDPLAYHLHA